MQALGLGQETREPNQNRQTPQRKALVKNQSEVISFNLTFPVDLTPFQTQK